MIARKKGYRLFAAKQGGSMIVEAAFGFTKLPLTVKDIDWKDLGWNSKALAGINPLGQVPTLELPDGTIMSESAAIMLHLADQVPRFPLVPLSKSATRPEFLRWLVFLTSALYPTYTYGDVPERWVGQPKDKGAGKALRASTDEHRKVLLKFLEGHVRGPWFLGRDLSALDLYMWVLVSWRPGREWYAQHCPKLLKVADALESHPVCRRVAARNRR